MCNPQRILIVDDNHEIVCATRIRLRAAGYETIEAYDGDAAIHSAIENHPDAIVLDVRMPVKDGLTMLTELKDRPDTKDIPVIMLSASVVDQQAALDAGARYFVRKPHEGRQLVQALANIITI